MHDRGGGEVREGTATAIGRAARGEQTSSCHCRCDKPQETNSCLTVRIAVVLLSIAERRL